MSRFFESIEEVLFERPGRLILFGLIIAVFTALILPTISTLYARTPIEFTAVAAQFSSMVAILFGISIVAMRGWKGYRERHGWYQVEITRAWIMGLFTALMAYGHYGFVHVSNPHGSAADGYVILTIASLLIAAFLACRFVYFGIRSLIRNSIQEINDTKFANMKRMKIGELIDEAAKQIGIDVNPMNCTITVFENCWLKFSPETLGAVFGSIFHSLVGYDLENELNKLMDQLIWAILFDGQWMRPHYTPGEQKRFLDAMCDQHKDIEELVIAAVQRAHQKKLEQIVQQEWKKFRVDIGTINTESHAVRPW